MTQPMAPAIALMMVFTTRPPIRPSTAVPKGTASVAFEGARVHEVGVGVEGVGEHGGDQDHHLGEQSQRHPTPMAWVTP